MEKTTIIGHIGKDADLRFSPDGRAVCSFSVATSRKWTDREGNKKDKTTWWRCALWGKRGEALAQYLNKGGKVWIEGRVNSDQYGNPRIWESDKGPRASYELVVTDIELLGGKRSSGQASGGEPDFGDPGNDDFGDF